MDVRSTPTDADLARPDLENEIELWSTPVALTPDGGSGSDGDAAWFASGLPVPFFNQVLATGDGPDAAALARAIDAIRARGVQSSDMGRPVGAAMGFREVLSFRVFVDDRPD